jgi:protein SCO1/2
MRIAAIVLILTFACGKAKIDNAAKPLSVPGEKVYTLQGRIVGRDAAENALTIDHRAVPGYMEAMTMDYIVRGAKIEALPPNGTTITATLHVTDEKGIWITNVADVAAHRRPQLPAAPPPAASR